METAKVIFFGVTGVMLALQFKGGKQEYGIYIGLGVSLLIFFRICDYLGEVGTQISRVTEWLDGREAYLGILLKVTGIAYLSELGANLCRDAGYQAVAAQIELFGKVMVLLAGMPVMLTLVDTILGFAA